MKLLRYATLLLVFCAVAAFPQTKDLGMGVYQAPQGPITLIIDTSLVSLKIDSPYVMFYAWMGATHNDQEITITPKTVALIFNGKEYPLATMEELRDNYNGMKDDYDIYKRLDKGAVIGSRVRLFRFTRESDFFPVLGLKASTPVEEASLYNDIGFRTKLYFKNPGFKHGDKATIKVWDKKDPAISAEVEVTIK
jgi:hypothetical protein